MQSDREYAELLERLRFDLAPKPELAPALPEIETVADWTSVYIRNGETYEKWTAIEGKWVRQDLEEIMIQDFYLELSKGNIDGHSHVNKFGENDAILGNIEEVIWDGSTASYPFPSTADITHISTAVDSTNMRGEVCEVQGLDINYNLVVQDVTLDATNSTTLVALTTPLLRIFRVKFQADFVGDQIINVTDSSGTIVYAVVSIGFNQTRMAVYTVPASKTAYVTKYYAGVLVVTNKIPTGYLVRLWASDRANSYEFQLKHSLGGLGDTIEHDFKPYLKLTEKTDIIMTGIPADNPGQISAGFDIILVDN